MDKRLKNKKFSGSTTLLFLLLSLFLLSPQSAWSAEDKAEILIFSLSPEKVKEKEGILKIQISTFSPIQQVTVKGKPRNFPKGASLLWLKIPYMLKPGVNVFEVYVKTKLGEEKKIIRTIYETPELLKKAKLGDSFQLITILSGVTKDNIDKVEDNSSKSKAFSTSILFVPSYRFDLFDDSSIFLRGVLMGDQHHNGKNASKKVLFKQASIEWQERESWAGVLTLSLGTNEAGTRDVPESTDPRDSLSKKYNRATSDNVYTLKAKQEFEKGTTWNWQIDRKKKLVEGSNDDSGFSTTLAAGYLTPIFGVKTTFGGTLEDTNLNGTYKDTKVYKTKLKIDYPIPPATLGVQHDFSQTEDKVADPSLDGKTKNRNQVYTLSLNYPAAPWCIFGLTQKQERQSSNIVGKTYKVNSTQLQVILIY
ncbi:hypothetical protein OAJ16_00815 [Deltaproteobacteria bacterium]|nr:hypothetical protein [Deltaproteobacteria bacterium]